MIFFALFAVPFFIALLMLLFGGKRITLLEFAVHMGIQAIVAGASAGLMFWSNTHDVEVWNGRVKSKDHVHVSCSHSYSCNCRQVCSYNSSTKSQSCYTHCDTCYEHSYDVDWRVFTSNNEQININRIDRQGLGEPTRWTQTTIGEPTAVTHSFTNYIKGSPDTLFRHQGLVEKYAKILPAYPQEIFNYWHLNRLVTVGYSVADAGVWNANLSEINAQYGAAKQANVILVLIKNQDSDFGQALEQHWLGGKKNDVVVTIGVNDDNMIAWSYVIAWTDNQIFKVKLRDSLMALHNLDRQAVMYEIGLAVNDQYVRKHMKDFKYLSASITPTPTEWVVSMVVGILTALGMAWVFWNYDLGEMLSGVRSYR